MFWVFNKDPFLYVFIYFMEPIMPKTDFSQTAAFIWSVADESLQPRAKRHQR